jgi:sensor domain CHASE-containing protein
MRSNEELYETYIDKIMQMISGSTQRNRSQEVLKTQIKTALIQFRMELEADAKETDG